MPHSHIRTNFCLEHYFMSTRNIYCHGELLHTIQMASIFSDSKTFVDMKLKSLPNITLENFNQFMDTTSRNPTRDQVIEFVNKTFDPAGSEFENWEPNDWTENAEFFNHVRDVELKEWAKKLNALWKFLGRKIKDDVKNNPDLYSIIYVPNPVIVPGGRFREFYYWDSYWIVRGLLLSEMTETVKGMLQNFLSIVDEYGFIPNGGRIYYKGEKEAYYSELKAAAESGWDFSSRWFILNATNKGNLTNLKTRYIIPVDLNAIIYWNAKYLSDFFSELGLPEKALEYMKYAEEWMESVNEILWHEDVGAWLDYDIMNNVRRNYFYPTNIAPLWTGCFDIRKGRQQIAKILKYLEKTRIMINLGGIPATLEQSGEQWDYPNAWPPLQYIMIYALDASGDDWAKELAYQISEKWVRSNYKTFNETSAMYEKYDATVSGGHGSGGEYNVQLGFGWTNGVIMELLDKYGDRLTAEDRFEDNKPLVASIAVDGSVSTFGQVLTLVLALVVPLGFKINCQKNYIISTVEIFNMASNMAIFRIKMISYSAWLRYLIARDLNKITHFVADDFCTPIIDSALEYD
uniref:Trehalase n=1 Tax=Timema poppense TaxID=170557 RepID=A0A7R9CMM7_TIMPO|nr:unnamed protein product [Timema poppensis]